MNVEDEADNNCELEETLRIIEEITPISDAPVPCPIVSQMSVEKKTEEMVDGGILEIKAMLPRNDESGDELGEEDDAEEIILCQRCAKAV